MLLPVPRLILLMTLTLPGAGGSSFLNPKFDQDSSPLQGLQLLLLQSRNAATC